MNAIPRDPEKIQAIVDLVAYAVLWALLYVVAAAL